VDLGGQSPSAWRHDAIGSSVLLIGLFLLFLLSRGLCSHACGGFVCLPALLLPRKVSASLTPEQTPAPASFVKEMLDCGMFYLNRVMKEGGVHADWAKALIAVGDELRDFVKKHHTTGLAWGKKVWQS
jgi:hypothetical protein